MAIEITQYKEHTGSNTLRAFVSIRLTGVGIEIHGCTLHEKNGKKWVQLPSKAYQTAEGKTAWSPIVDFYDKGREPQFQKQVFEALERYQAQPKYTQTSF